MKKLTLLLLLLLGTVPLAAQLHPTGVFPPHPIAGEEVRFYVLVPATCYFLGPPVFNGNTITITRRRRPGGCLLMFGSISARLGPLAPGTYTVNVVGEDGSLLETATFDVAANVPALDARGLAVLSIAIAAAAFLTLRRAMP